MGAVKYKGTIQGDYYTRRLKRTRRRLKRAARQAIVTIFNRGWLSLMCAVSRIATLVEIMLKRAEKAYQEAYAHSTQINGIFPGLMTAIEEKNLEE